VAAVVVACAAGVVAAVAGAANPAAGPAFLLPGHWVYNAALGAVYHVDGATGDVDASAEVPGDAGDQVVQGETSGFVVGSRRVTEFSKSSLAVVGSSTPASRSRPEAVETAGGPYLVYLREGTVARLGERPVVLSVGGPVGMPVATRDGTLWLPRTGAGLLCRLTAGSTALSCEARLPEGHAGALTVVGDRVVFVDTTDDTVHDVRENGLGPGRALGVDAPEDARLASTDVAGRVVILDGHRMHLVDATAPRPAAPVTVDLPAGDYADPVSTGEVVALVDKDTGTLTTYGGDGERRGSTTVPAEDGDPRITRGEDDRIYVDGAEGEHVVVVDEDGELTGVPITREDTGTTATPPRGGTTAAPPRPAPPRPAPAPSPATEREQPPPARPTPTVRARPPVRDQPPPRVRATAPGAPTGVRATAGDATATVHWGPAPDNRSPITGYAVSWPGGRRTAPPGARSVSVGGLANGTRYVFTVTAVNGVGPGPGVSTNAVTPVAPVSPAAAPGGLNADYDVDDRPTRDVTVSWRQPALGGGTLLHYLVRATGVADRTVTGTVTTYEQLAASPAVTVTVQAVTRAPDGRTLTGAPASLTLRE
jgi:hypothetical protein